MLSKALSIRGSRNKYMDNTNKDYNNDNTKLSKEEFIELIMQADDETLQLIEHLLSDSALLP